MAEVTRVDHFNKAVDLLTEAEEALRGHSMGAPWSATLATIAHGHAILATVESDVAASARVKRAGRP